jgi:hypothetical protein
MNVIAKQISSSALAIFYGGWFAPAAQAYAFNMIVPDVRQPAAVSGGSACPAKARQLTSAGSIAIQWSTALNANPVTIVTQDQTATGRLTEIEQVITQSIAVWTAVSGTTLVPGTFSPVARTAMQNACGSDGLNTICFDQADMAFTPGGGGIHACDRDGSHRTAGGQQHRGNSARTNSGRRHLLQSERLADDVCDTANAGRDPDGLRSRIGANA